MQIICVCVCMCILKKYVSSPHLLFPLSTSWFRWEPPHLTSPHHFITSPQTSPLTSPGLPHIDAWVISQTDTFVPLLAQTPQWSSKVLSIKFKPHNMVCTGPASLATLPRAPTGSFCLALFLLPLFQRPLTLLYPLWANFDSSFGCLCEQLLFLSICLDPFCLG